MTSFNCLSILSAILLLVGCKASEDFSGSTSVTVKKLREEYKEEVTFELTNVSNEEVQIESTEQFYIEKESNGSWSRIPFIPCLCGTPCRPPTIEKLKPSNSMWISWNLISRKCNRTPSKSPLQNMEKRVSNGSYRMIFIVNRERDGMRIEPEKLTVNFSVQTE